MLNTINKIYFIIFLLLPLLNFYGNEKSTPQPSWVYLKRAENYKEKGDYSIAIIEARKARLRLIEEKMELFFSQIKLLYRDKTNFELRNMLKEKELELKQNDNYPQYHELLGDLYVLTDFLDEAEAEYRIALQQHPYFDYKDKILEIKYKMADVYHKKNEYELEDIILREIVTPFFMQKEDDYWNRMKYNIRKDQTLSHVFRIYRNEGIKYLDALYKIGRRSALLKRKNESLFYLVNAAIVWMSYYHSLIKKQFYNFQYTDPVDFINYIKNRKIFEFFSHQSKMDEILFYIGYNYYMNNEVKISNHFFELAQKFSTNTDKEEEMINRVNYLLTHPGHMITYDEIID